jgi:hypothetical protein
MPAPPSGCRISNEVREALVAGRHSSCLVVARNFVGVMAVILLLSKSSLLHSVDEGLCGMVVQCSDSECSRTMGAQVSSHEWWGLAQVLSESGLQGLLCLSNVHTLRDNVRDAVQLVHGGTCDAGDREAARGCNSLYEMQGKMYLEAGRPAAAANLIPSGLCFLQPHRPF